MKLQILKPLLLASAMANLLFGLSAGLARLGWSMPFTETVIHHGAIMTGGFLGTLIALEKVIPLKKWWLYVGPLCSASSIVMFFLQQFDVAVILLVVASAWFVMVYLIYLSRQFESTTFMAMIGAACWLTGNVMLIKTRFYPAAFPWWMTFLIFTIISERLELSKFLPVPQKMKQWLMVIMAILLLGIVLPFHGWGMRLTGFSMIVISIWMLRFDVIHLTIKKTGQLKFMAVALLSGYVALMLEGSLLIFLKPGPLAYDMIIHTFFLGFVFMMIFAHGPVIIPGLLALSIKPYHRFLYAPVILMWSSLILRIVSDAGFLPPWVRMWSGWTTACAIMLYFLLILINSARQVMAKGR